MIELKQGNPNNLKGKVLVYSIFQDRGRCELPHYIKDGSIFAIYAATDPADFKKRTGATEYDIEKIKKREQKLNESIKEKFDEEMLKKIADNTEMFSVYSDQVFVRDEKEIFDIYVDDDVVFADKFSLTNKCIKSAVLALNIYMMKYDEQSINNMGINGAEKNVEAITESYKDFHGEELMDKLRLYVGSLIDATNYQYPGEIKRIRKELFEFFKGSPFIPTLINLRDMIEADHPQKLRLLELYYEQIKCIEEEAYERVIEIRKGIEQILEI